MDSLGNVAVKEGGPMRLKDPSAASTLLDLAQERARLSQRVLFFCSCGAPGVDGQNGCCHRTLVARLVLEAAKQRNRPLQVVEWPGGEPGDDAIFLEAPTAAFKKVIAGAHSIPSEDPVDLGARAALPWYPMVAVRSRDLPDRGGVVVLSPPAHYRVSGWFLPACNVPPGIDIGGIPGYARNKHAAEGYGVRRWQG